MASWACSRCTFLNPASERSKCQVCLSPAAPSASASASASASTPSSSFSALRWPCAACTFSNPFSAASCEICGTGAVRSVALDELGASEFQGVGSVFFPLRRCGAKATGSEAVEVVDVDESEDRKEALKTPNSKAHTLKMLSYNVWFREDLEVYKRMEAIGDLIRQYSPDVICFQEVTPQIYTIFQNATWWKDYKCSHTLDMVAERAYFCIQLSKLPVKGFRVVPFPNSIMGRELSLAEVSTEPEDLVVATTHLESPCPTPPKWDQMYSPERVCQANFSIEFLKGLRNVIFCGDMNWNDKLDGPFPLPEGWLDAWLKLRPEENGFTYDTKSNPMLSANRTLQTRLDRFVCRLTDFKISSIQIIGNEAIPGTSYVKEKRAKGKLASLVLPVLPSDHYGLLLTIQRI